MKFTVTCLVSSVNSSLLAESEAVTKEITVANPRATVQNLRATVAIQFRLKVVAFEFRFDRHEGATESDSAAPSSSPSAASAVVDFGDEKKLLTECGLQEGDHLTVVPKNYSSLSAAGAAAVTASEASSSEVPATKRVRIESRGEVDAPAVIASEDEDAEEEESELDEEDDADDSEEDGDAKGQNDLFAALREVVPDLTVLRQEFLANPQAVMERIERNHPSLFQVIVQNQESFVTLMNNEQLTKAAQSMLHGGTMGGDEDEDEGGSLEWSTGEEDEEMDEETAEQMSALFQSYITSAARSGDSGDFDAADLAELEASGMHVEEVGDGDGNASGSARIGKAKRQSDKEFILSRVPSEEDEKKIQALTELGFTYEQCKVAFYLCHRSIDRASNMLFEAPPEI
ncbi:XPC-binding domain/UBA/TS-N domain containing protein, putative [Leishmania donovani]|uniref:XPC-binding domain/UBA/TS-N domain containing protein, putative n=1 Tax=Leishmania donovani TaxID=5661 RepID=A0A3Q8IFF1_LEIDO|nr:XPC-binding domain/UBA/TS-N domain containing protein, putative [Leishmania donovani]